MTKQVQAPAKEFLTFTTTGKYWQFKKLTKQKKAVTLATVQITLKNRRSYKGNLGFVLHFYRAVNNSTRYPCRLYIGRKHSVFL